MFMISLFLLIILTKSTYNKTPSKKNSVLNFTHELNKNNKISFLDVLIDTNNNNNFSTSTYKKPSSNNSCTLNFKSECPFRYKKAIINNLISLAKLISSSKTIFYKEVENIKQALINNGFPHYIVDEQIKHMIKMLTNKINTVLLHSVNKHISNFFTVTKCTTIINQMKKY